MTRFLTSTRSWIANGAVRDVTTLMGRGTWSLAKNHPLTKPYRRPGRIEEWADERSIQSIIANNLWAPQKSGSYHVALLFYPHRPRAIGQSDPIITGADDLEEGQLTALFSPTTSPIRLTESVNASKAG
jgi:hypothetical protein